MRPSNAIPKPTAEEPPAPVCGTSTTPSTWVAETTTVTTCGLIPVTATQPLTAAGVLEAVIELEVDADDVEVVVGQNVGPGGRATVIVAVPVFAALNSSWSVPSASYAPLTFGKTLLFDEDGIGYSNKPPPLNPWGASMSTGGSVKSMTSPTVACTGAVGKSWVTLMDEAAAAGTAISSPAAATTAIAAAARTVPDVMARFTTNPPLMDDE